MNTPRLAAFFACLAIGAGPALADRRAHAPTPTAALSSEARAVLDEHNRIRRQAGATPLVWSDTLAAGARQWAAQLARSGRFEHSHASGLGENLAALSPTGEYAPTRFLDLWIAERRDFVPGRFPQVSRTGDWSDVGHYTQMIWPQTRQLGCAEVDGSEQTVLVCRYWPAGNVVGERID